MNPDKQHRLWLFMVCLSFAISTPGSAQVAPRSKQASADHDRDGIKDKDDKCPTVPGPAANAGCPWPDTDKDGIPDNVDKCPRHHGPKSNGGCPRIIIRRPHPHRTPSRVFFPNHQHKLTKRAVRVLQAVIKILKKHHKLRIRIEGHTDNQLSLKKSIRLGRLRAQVVKKYLVAQGISAKRLVVKSYGLMKPLVRSHSPRSRTVNNRVGFFIIR